MEKRQQFTAEEIENRFHYHPPRNDTEIDQHEDVTCLLVVAAHEINDLIPDGRDKAIVMTKLEEARMWANAALAHERGLEVAGLGEAS